MNFKRLKINYGLSIKYAELGLNRPISRCWFSPLCSQVGGDDRSVALNKAVDILDHRPPLPTQVTRGAIMFRGRIPFPQITIDK